MKINRGIGTMVFKCAIPGAIFNAKLVDNIDGNVAWTGLEP